MKLYFLDETNITKEDHLGFFIYGGLIVDEKDVRGLAMDFLALKKMAGFKKETEVKWSSVDQKEESEKHKIFKEEALKLLKKYSCKIIVYLAPQDFYHDRVEKGKKFIYRSNTERQARSFCFAINVCLMKFDNYLDEVGGVGMALADEFSAGKKTLVDHCFSIFPDGPNIASLSNIVYPVINVNSQYSQLHQLSDIVLGAIQRSLKEMGHNFLPLLKDSFWRRKDPAGFKATDYGFNIHPRTPKTAYIRRALEQLRMKFRRLVNEKQN